MAFDQWAGPVTVAALDQDGATMIITARQNHGKTPGDRGRTEHQINNKPGR